MTITRHVLLSFSSAVLVIATDVEPLLATELNELQADGWVTWQSRH